jgi:zinc protease
LPVDYIEQRERFVRQLTLDEIEALAQKYIQPEQLVYVVVGDKQTQFDELKELGLGDPVLLDKEGKPVTK